MRLRSQQNKFVFMLVILSLLAATVSCKRAASIRLDTHTATLKPNRVASEVLGDNIIGLWSNIEDDARGTTKLAISRNGNKWEIEGWGACHPSDCNWGKTSLHLLGTSISDTSSIRGLAVWDFGFSMHYVILRVEDKQLFVENFTVFKDNSGRSNYFGVEQFERLKSNKTISTMGQCANKGELEDRVTEAKRVVDAFQGGHVIVGRVVLDGEGDVRDVIAQMEIFSDGCFAGETKDLIGPVGFRMHRYAPYDLQLKGVEGDLVDVGTIHMTPLREDQLVGLKGKVVLEEKGDPSSAILSLSVRNGPVNTPHNGTSPRSFWPKPIEIHAIENGLIETSGFSPIEYWCRLEAPGYLTKEFPIEFSAGQTSDLGTIKLEKPKQIRLSYIVSAQPPFDLNNLKTVTIPAGTRWKATDDIYGWDLEFKQEKGSIVIDYSYAPCFLQDLGKGEIADYVNFDETKIGQNSPLNQQANNEHVYLLHQGHWKRWVLFKIVTDTPTSSTPKE